MVSKDGSVKFFLTSVILLKRRRKMLVIRLDIELGLLLL